MSREGSLSRSRVEYGTSSSVESEEMDPQNQQGTYLMGPQNTCQELGCGQVERDAMEERLMGTSVGLEQAQWIGVQMQDGEENDEANREDNQESESVGS